MTATEIAAAKCAELLKMIETTREASSNPEAIACMDALKQWADELAAKQVEKK